MEGLNHLLTIKHWHVAIFCDHHLRFATVWCLEKNDKDIPQLVVKNGYESHDRN